MRLKSVLWFPPIVCLLLSASVGAQSSNPKNQPDPSAPVPSKIGQYSSILDAVIARDIDAVKAFLAAGAPPDEPRKFDGTTPLMLAVTLDNFETAKALIDAGADVNRAGLKTALETAVENNSAGLAAFLLKNGADPNRGIVNAPLICAVFNRNLVVLNLLLKAGADPRRAKWIDNSALATACMFKCPSEIVSRLVEAGGRPGMESHRETTLMKAVYYGTPETVEYLLTLKPDVNASLPNGPSVLMRAAYRGDVRICKMLIAAGARIDSSPPTGWVIDHAVNVGNVELYLLLLETGVQGRNFRTDWEMLVEKTDENQALELARALKARGLDIAGIVRSEKPLDSKGLEDRIERKNWVDATRICQREMIRATFDPAGSLSEGLFWRQLRDRCRRGLMSSQSAEIPYMLGFETCAVHRFEREFLGSGNHDSIRFLRAAACAALTGDQPQVLGFLNAAGKRGVSAPPGDFVNVLRRVAVKPDDVDARIDLAERLMSGRQARQDDLFAARTMLFRLLRNNPTPSQQLRIQARLHETARTLGDYRGAEKIARRVLELPPDPTLTDGVLLSQARTAFAFNRYGDAEAWLKELNRHATDPRLKVDAVLFSADLYEKLGKERQMIGALKTAADGSAFGKLISPGEQEAVRARLGFYLKGKGRFAEALPWFSAWTPSETDGFAQFERTLAVTECLTALGRADEALDRHLRPYLTEKNVRYWDYRLFGPYVGAVERAGRLKETLRRLESERPDAVAKATTDDELRRSLALKILRLREWALSKNVERLADELTGNDPADDPFPSLGTDVSMERRWYRRTVARTLADFGGDEFPVLEKRFRNSLKAAEASFYTDESEKTRTDRHWLLYGLALSRSPSAEAFFKSLDRDVRNGDCLAVTYDRWKQIAALRAGR